MASNADHHPCDGRRIMDKAQLIKEVGPASHLAERRRYLKLYHHSFVAEVKAEGVQIIHYGPDGCSVKIHEEFLNFDDMNFKDGVYLICSNGYPESKEEKEKAIRRARKRLTEVKYMFAINNCEHFVTWALTKKPVSYQIANAEHTTLLKADALDAFPYKKAVTNTLPGIEAIVEIGIEKGVEKVEEVIMEKVQTELIFPLLAEMAVKVKQKAAEKALTKGIPALGEKAVKTLGTAVAEKAVTKGIPALGEKAVEKLGTAVAEKAVGNGIPALGGKAVETLGTSVAEKAVAKSIPALREKVVETVGKSAAKAVGKSTATSAGKSVASKTGTVAAEATGKAVVKKVGSRGVQAGKALIKKAPNKAIVSQISTKSVLKAAGKAAVITTIVESALLARDIINLNESCENGYITERDFKRGVVTKTTGTIGSIAGGTAGTVIGQILCPMPVLGGMVGGFFGSLLVRGASSVVSGFLFDKA